MKVAKQVYFSLDCPNCGKEIPNENAVYCPNCRREHVRLTQKSTSLPVVLGILSIIAASISVSFGVLGMLAYATSVSYPYYYSTPPAYHWLSAGIFSMVAFAFGLAGGVSSLRKRRLKAHMIGTGFTLASGIISTTAFILVGWQAWIGLALFGLPMIVLSVLGMILAACATT